MRIDMFARRRRGQIVMTMRQIRIRKSKSAPRREPEEIDLRTPSGRALPF